jgi:hypothetical protein
MLTARSMWKVSSVFVQGGTIQARRSTIGRAQMAYASATI